MRTSGAPADGPLFYIPLIVVVGLVLASLGGPSATLRSIDRFVGGIAKAVVDVVRSAAASL